jgi:hypothetical protein
VLKDLAQELFMRVWFGIRVERPQPGYVRVIVPPRAREVGRQAATRAAHAAIDQGLMVSFERDVDDNLILRTKVAVVEFIGI